MIELTHGDILRANAEALVNTVNCVGVMGRGIALQFRKAYPDNFKVYEAACQKGEVQPGKMLVFETQLLTGPRYIINFPTKRHWKGQSRMEDIDSGLNALVREIQDRGIRSIAVPPLGCGLGGLDWRKVRPKITSALEALPEVEVLLFEPGGAPAAEAMVTAKQAPEMTPGRAVLIELMSRYLAAVMDPFVTLLEIHKLMYFLQEAGENLRLRYEKGTYGPYATNLRHVLNLVEGHFLSGYGDAEDDPQRPIELLPGASKAAAGYVEGHPETRARFERVVKLIHGFETPYGLELLATVHWVCQQEGARSEDEAVEGVHGWNERKKGFDRKQISLARRVLMQQGWIEELVA
ncbi:type II toxin-antitoxin system antitoxin DNA ADP-ribosyl glycohydrolase DarG [Paludibaculum fermentans]|uniref:type II toxin-antitoxin system antitoxin DNA ADP-ribosyl glycohydrolase DarG n=1 Tax=Paludibaculum fermentans TaxID=1473598 RepID=UPI003EBF066F